MTVAETFQGHILSVNKLMNFDRDVLDLAIDGIATLQTRLQKHHGLDNPQLTAERTLHMLRGFREHDSLRPRYNTIFNQALVLLVSYFSSSVHDLFLLGVSAALDSDQPTPLLQEQIRISFADLRDAKFDLREVAPTLLVQAKDISFQDMQSIARAFKEHLDVSIEKSEAVNDIILGQGCRHVIVHAGGLVNERLIRQVAGARPRRIKQTLALHADVQFTVEEVLQVAASMSSYIQTVSALVSNKFDVRV